MTHPSDNEKLIDEARDMATRRWLTAATQPDVQATLAMLSDALESSDARLAAVRELYEKRCRKTVDVCTDEEDLFLCDLRDALDGGPSYSAIKVSGNGVEAVSF